MNEKDVAKVYETLLCSPGMNEPVKLDHKVTRKTILLLSQIVTKAMSGKTGETTNLDGIADKESIAELNELVNNSLEKAGLTVLSSKLKAIHQ